MDKIIRTLICDGSVQVSAMTTTDLTRRAIEIHGTQPAASKILGGLLTAGAYLASSIKSERGAVSVTVKSEHGDGCVSVSADALLHVRGYADGECSHTLKGGNITVVREDGYSRPFVGTCELGSDDVSDAISTYFQQSEQIPTAVDIAVSIDEGGACLYAGGLIVQLLPDASEEIVTLAENRLKKYSADGANLPAEEIISQYFGDVLYGEKTISLPEYKCNCSEEKIRSVLYAAGKSEIMKIIEEEGKVRVHCHYCNKDYVYDKKLIEEIFR